MQHPFKPYKITKSKPELKVSRPLLTFNTCTICNTSLNPLTEPTAKHCTPCKERITKLNQSFNQIKQNNAQPNCNNTIITDNYNDLIPNNTTKGI